MSNIAASLKEDYAGGDDIMIVLREEVSSEKADVITHVLLKAGIPFTVDGVPERINIWVEREDWSRANKLIVDALITSFPYKSASSPDEVIIYYEASTSAARLSADITLLLLKARIGFRAETISGSSYIHVKKIHEKVARKIVQGVREEWAARKEKDEIRETKPLSDYTEQELRAELHRRVRADLAPKSQSYANITLEGYLPLRSYADGLIANFVKTGKISDYSRQKVFESALVFVFGDKIWEYLNDKGVDDENNSGN